MAVDAVKLARHYADDVEFYAEDAGRADPAYLFEMIEAAIDAGATVVNIPDTTGYAVPEQYGALIRSIREKVPEHRPGRHQRALPRRSRHGRGQYPGRRAERRAPGGRHHQRHRRKGRQRGARRSRHGPPHARATTSACTPISRPASLSAPAAWWPTCSACRCRPTKQWWAATPFPTARESTWMDS